MKQDTMFLNILTNIKLVRATKMNMITDSNYYKLTSTFITMCGILVLKYVKKCYLFSQTNTVLICEVLLAYLFTHEKFRNY